MTTPFKILDLVLLKNDLPKYDLKSGEHGTIVESWAPGVWEVEFVLQDGTTRAMVELRDDQLTPSHSGRKGTWFNPIWHYSMEWPDMPAGFNLVGWGGTGVTQAFSINYLEFDASNPSFLVDDPEKDQEAYGVAA